MKLCMPEVALVLGNEEKLSAQAWRAHRDVLARAPFGIAAEEKVAVNDIMSEYKNEIPDWSDGEMYQALMILFAAIEKAGSPEPVKIVTAMPAKAAIQ